MSDDLPIRLTSDQSYATEVAALEAWLNFETLKANWFCDESRIVDCCFEVLDEQQFNERCEQLQNQHWMVARQHGFALRVNKPNFKVEGLISAGQESDNKKLLKKRLKKAVVIIAATLALPSVW